MACNYLVQYINYGSTFSFHQSCESFHVFGSKYLSSALPAPSYSAHVPPGDSWTSKLIHCLEYWDFCSKVQQLWVSDVTSGPWHGLLTSLPTTKDKDQGFLAKFVPTFVREDTDCSRLEFLNSPLFWLPPHYNFLPLLHLMIRGTVDRNCIAFHWCPMMEISVSQRLIRAWFAADFRKLIQVFDPFKGSEIYNKLMKMQRLGHRFDTSSERWISC